MNRLLLTVPTFLLFAAACSGDAPTTNQPPTSPTTGPAAMEEDHGPPRPLGKLTIGERTFEVVLLGDLEAGKEANVDLVFASKAERPDTVRGWVGLESAVGSRKAKLYLEGDTVVHGHMDVPKEIPDGSKIWIEIESGGKTAAAGIGW